MATFHRLPFAGADRVVGLVKGAPDVVLSRCGGVLMADGTRESIDIHQGEIIAANDELARRGLRVLAMAVHVLDPEESAALESDPMAQVQDLTFVGLVGIIDPLRPEAVEAVRIAQRAGIDVRMITGDHLVTATAIGEQLGLGPGGTTGADMATKLQEVSGGSGDGEKCTSFADCADIILGGGVADYDGYSGPITFDEAGDPTEASIGIFQYGADNMYTRIETR